MLPLSNLSHDCGRAWRWSHRNGSHRSDIPQSSIGGWRGGSGELPICNRPNTDQYLTQNLKTQTWTKFLKILQISSHLAAVVTESFQAVQEPFFFSNTREI